MLRYMETLLEFAGSITLLATRVLRFAFSGRVNGALLLHQMVLLGINSIPIGIMVLGFGGSVFTFVLAREMDQRGAGSLVGGIMLLILLREIIPLFVGIVLAGKVGAAITSELGSMQISQQLDALRALSTDPHWFLTTPRVLAGILMTPVVAVFAGYSAWWTGYYTAHLQVGMSYNAFTSSVRMLVDEKDFFMCFIKCAVFGASIVLTACHFGYTSRGGAAGVGRGVTNGVTINIALLFALDLLITALW
jgi:phospholipid/cholesterol/gamma-HCH transport system permease protein